jgi:hypothetical protein
MKKTKKWYSVDFREHGIRTLPRWRQYTIDERLQEFRKVTRKHGNPEIEFIPFASKKGMRIQYLMDIEKLRKVM